MRYFVNPRHVGRIESPDAIGEKGDISCGDFLQLSLRIKNNIIIDIKFKCQGCPAAIATSEALCELAINKSLKEAYALTDENIVEHLCGLPIEKTHCSNLGVDALKNAIESYWNRCKA